MTPMRVIEVSTCRQTGQPLVLLQAEGRDRWLAFYVPMNEANRLARCLGMTSCPCTPIFELAEQLVGHMGAAVVRAYPGRAGLLRHRKLQRLPVFRINSAQP
jgi:bifunctional DNase/RNase